MTSPYAGATMIPAISAPAEDREAFVVRVYQHVGLALAAFVAFEVMLFATGIADALTDFVFRNGGGTWLLILGGFMVGQWLASNAAHRLENTGLQYAGLFGSALLQALIFAPFLGILIGTGASSDIWIAGAITAVSFVALTIVGMTTKKDLSFMRPMMMWGGIVAIGLIVAAAIFGFQLGVWFSAAMIALMGATIIYQTQAIIRQYPVWAHVGAALALFSSLMTLFWYVLRLVSALRR